MVYLAKTLQRKQNQHTCLREAGKMTVVLSQRLFDFLNSPETSPFPPVPLNRSAFLNSSLPSWFPGSQPTVQRCSPPRMSLMMQDKKVTLRRITVLAPKLTQGGCWGSALWKFLCLLWRYETSKSQMGFHNLLAISGSFNVVFLKAVGRLPRPRTLYLWFYFKSTLFWTYFYVQHQQQPWAWSFQLQGESKALKGTMCSLGFPSFSPTWK